MVPDRNVLEWILRDTEKQADKTQFKNQKQKEDPRFIEILNAYHDGMISEIPYELLGLPVKTSDKR
jgi:hypothetical protein